LGDAGVKAPPVFGVRESDSGAFSESGEFSELRVVSEGDEFSWIGISLQAVILTDFEKDRNGFRRKKTKKLRSWGGGGTASKKDEKEAVFSVAGGRCSRKKSQRESCRRRFRISAVWS
jgi:hypothetical protein